MILDIDLIRRRRRELGLSQREVGRHIGASTATVTRLEAGANHDNIALRQLARLADVLAVDPADLLERPVEAGPVEARPDDPDLVHRVGALLGAANAPVATATLATATGASLEEVTDALARLDVTLRPVGMRVHDVARGVEIVTAAGATDRDELSALLRGQHAAHGLTRLDAQLLARAAAGTLDPVRAGNADQVALARLENAGLLDTDLGLAADVRYSLALTSGTPPQGGS